MKTKLTPPKWRDKEEYEQVYREEQIALRWITALGAILCVTCHVINTFVFWSPHRFYWWFWGIGTGGLLISVASLFVSLVIKHEHPNTLAWYDKNQGDDAVTINDSE